MEEQILNRMKEVADAIQALPADLRPAAFEMMRDYILNGTGSRVVEADSPGEDDKEAFFAELELRRPADGVLAITAYIYKNFGTQSFGLSEIRSLAEEVGLTIPDRIDMTLKGAKRQGKPLFRTLGRGLYAPTVHGERALRAEFGVTKGHRRREAPAEESAG